MARDDLVDVDCSRDVYREVAEIGGVMLMMWCCCHRL